MEKLKTINNNLKSKNIKLKDLRIKTIRKAKLDKNIKFDKSINLSSKTNLADNNTKMMVWIKEIFTFDSKQYDLIGAKLLFSDLEKTWNK